MTIPNIKENKECSKPLIRAMLSSFLFVESFPCTGHCDKLLTTYSSLFNMKHLWIHSMLNLRTNTFKNTENSRFKNAKTIRTCNVGPLCLLLYTPQKVYSYLGIINHITTIDNVGPSKCDFCCFKKKHEDYSSRMLHVS